MGFRWTSLPSRAWDALVRAWHSRIERGVRAVAERHADDIEAWMKENAAWRDQTGRARRELRAEVELIAHDMAEIIVRHGEGVFYGVFLELNYGGRYAILGPAVDHWGPILWEEVRAVIEG